MAILSAFKFAAVATTLLSVINVKADQITVCKDSSCNNNCPLYAEELDSPDCWIYGVGELDNHGYELNPAGGYVVYLDIPQPEPGCQHLIGSGPGCGAIVGRFENAICTRQAWTTTLSFSKCCGECGGVGSKIKGTPITVNLLASNSITKRDCSSFSSSGSTYDIIGPAQSVSDPVSGPADVLISRSVTSGRQTSFSASVGDPFGIISVETGITFEESISTSLSYTFQVLEGQSGYIAWAPLMQCVDGTLSGCDGASDESGQACTPKKNPEGNVVGQYNFVSTSRLPGKRTVPLKH